MDRQTSFVLCVMTYAIALDRETGRKLGHSVVGQASRLQLPPTIDENGFSIEDEFSSEDYAAEYVEYEYGIGSKPEWLQGDTGE